MVNDWLLFNTKSAIVHHIKWEDDVRYALDQHAEFGIYETRVGDRHVAPLYRHFAPFEHIILGQPVFVLMP